MDLKQSLCQKQWVVFVLGLLTGALLVTLVFTYQASQNSEGALLKLQTPTAGVTMPGY